MDGYLKIKTKIDNSDVDKQIKNLEDKIKKMQTENNRSSKEQSSIEAEINVYEELAQNAEEYRHTIKKLEQERANMVKMNPNLAVQSTPEYLALENQLESIRQKYIDTTKELDKQAPKVDKLYIKLDKVKSKQSENNSKINQFRNEISKINTNNIKKGIDSVGKSLSNQIKKVGKLAFAVVGIRSAWFAVSRAVNLVNRYDQQTATDFEYMGYVIAQVLIPIVQQLVKVLYNVLTYVNAITTAWFGFNLFANASVDSFKKMKTDAKEIKKCLQGFDEMNVLSDNSNETSSNSIPSMDLSGMQEEVPDWLQWIIDNKDLIISTLGGISGAILAIKLGLGGIKALGIGLLITGILETVQAFLKYLEDPTWENFGKIISGIGIAILGVGIIIGSVPAIVAGIVATIVGLVISNWDKIKNFLQRGIDWLNSKVDWVQENFGIVGKIIFQTITGVLQELLNMFDGLFSGIKTILDGIIKVFKGIFTGDMKTVFEGFKQIFQGVFDSLWSIAKVPLNLIIRGINTLIRGANKIKFDVPDWVPGLGGMTFGFNIAQIPLLARGGVISQPTQAIIGEAGAEAVMPLENNLEWIDKLADMISNKISGNGNVNVYLDGRLIQRQMQKRSQQVSFATNS